MIFQIDGRARSLGSNRDGQPANEQAALQRVKEKEGVRTAVKDARNAHFQDIVDRDIDVRDSIAASMQARSAGSDRIALAHPQVERLLLHRNWHAGERL